MNVKSIVARVGPTVCANLFSQIVVVAVQLLLVPILLSGWGAKQYGVWLLLSAVPAYLTLSDFGLTFIAKNEMSISFIKNNKQSALIIFQSVFLSLLLISIIIISLVIALCNLIDLSHIFFLDEFPLESARRILILLALNVVLTQFFLLQCAGVRCIGRPAAEVMWGALARLGEGVVTGFIAWAGGPLTQAALLVLINRVAFCLLLLMWLRRVAPWLRWGFSRVSKIEIARLLHPSLSYMFVSIANAFMIQGPVVILGAVAQPEMVVIYSTSRTLARLGTSAANLVNYSFTPEYTTLFGRADQVRFRNLIKLHMYIALVGILVYSLGIVFAGNWIMAKWTDGRIAIFYPFFGVLNLSVAAEMAWGAMLTPLTATNRHTKAAYLFAGLSLLAIAACYGLTKRYGLLGAILPVAFVHCFMLLFLPSQMSRNYQLFRRAM